ncbi:MAG: regulatory protein RecX [Porticoccaceae bacterium]
MPELAFTEPNPEKVIRLKAMDLLARREHSRQELYRKLLSRFPEEENLLYPVLDQLAEEGLQSDSRFSESFIRARISKGQGPQRIARELQQRGVSSVLISESLSCCDTDWYELALAVLNKKYRETVCDSYAEKAKRSRFLQYRGFTAEQIQAVLD